MKFIPYYILTLIFLTSDSCKKNDFVHVEQQVNFPCTCCAMADTIEGVYLGNVMELQMITYIPTVVFDTITDSTFTLTVSRVEQLQSNYLLDSNICAFILSGLFPDTIQISGSSILGNYASFSGAPYQVARFDNNVITFGNITYGINGNSYPYYTWKFEGQKQ